jgi:hypothetical protein
MTASATDCTISSVAQASRAICTAIICTQWSDGWVVTIVLASEPPGRPSRDAVWMMSRAKLRRSAGSWTLVESSSRLSRPAMESGSMLPVPPIKKFVSGQHDEPGVEQRVEPGGVLHLGEEQADVVVLYADFMSSSICSTPWYAARARAEIFLTRSSGGVMNRVNQEIVSS